MPLNTAIAGAMVTLGIGVGVLGKWGAHRAADLISDSDLYSRRVEAHFGWSSDRCFRLYFHLMGSFPPFETRTLPEWLDTDPQIVYNIRQYKLTNWSQAPPDNQYRLQNQLLRIKYQIWDQIAASHDRKLMMKALRTRQTEILNQRKQQLQEKQQKQQQQQQQHH